MDAVVLAIAALGQRTWIDYFAIFGPFVLSAVAIWIAVSGTQRQNKIALFEKRFEFYQVLERCVTFQIAIHNSTTQDEIQAYFLAAFGNKVVTKLTQGRLYDATIELYGQTKRILQEGAFLFNFDTKTTTDKLCSDINVLLTCDTSHTSFESAYTDYAQTIIFVKDKLIAQIERTLTLKGGIHP